MDILNEISAQLQDVDENTISTPLITEVLLKLENCTKTLQKQNKAAPFVQIAENLSKLFEGFLLSTIEPTSAGLDFIRETIGFKKNLDSSTEQEKDLLSAAEEINLKLDLLLAGKEVTDDPADIRDQGSETGIQENLPPDIDLIIEYDLPISSDEDALSYEEFVNESIEHIESIENKILELENSPDDMELINDIFRPFHSMKGAAGFLGLLDINKLSHEAESLLDLCRKGKISIDQEVINILLESLDVAKRLLGVTSLKVDQKLGKLPEDEKIQSFPIGHTLQKLQLIIDNAGKKETKREHREGSKLGEILVQKGEITSDQFEEALKTQSKRLGEILVEKGATTQDKIHEALKTQKKTGKKISPPIKVDTKKLDNLMELIGELVIAQTLVGEDKVLINESNQNLSKNVSNLGKITKTLQEQMMSVRMVPLKQTFMKMNRLVRDVSNKTNKKVDLRLKGEETEIDKTIVDELNDPLIHLLRNSVDHGIEKPEDRIKAGKSETGVVNLNAYHQGGNVIIEIADDGKGLSRDNIYKKALEKKLVNKNGNDYTDEEIFNFILLPGFSTVDVASDISGRGVGMDVVSNFITNLGGKLEIHSKEGEGSVFTIKLPLTMSIVDGMVVKVGKQRYIIPTMSIIESIRPSKDAITTVKGKGEVINVRGQLYPMIRLHKLFGIPPVCNNPWEALIILIENNGRIKGVMVDDLLGQQQVVIKTLGKLFKPVKEISGSAIMGDGLVGLILDAEGIINSG